DRRGEALPVGAQVGDLERAESAWRPVAELAEAVRRAAAESGRRRTARVRSPQRRRRRRDLAACDAHGTLRGGVHERDAPRRSEVRRLLAPPVPALVRPRPAGDSAADSPLHALADDGQPPVPAARRDPELRPEARLADRVRIQDESPRPVPRCYARFPSALSRRGGTARLPGSTRRTADQLPDSRRARGRT